MLLQQAFYSDGNTSKQHSIFVELDKANNCIRLFSDLIELDVVWDIQEIKIESNQFKTIVFATEKSFELISFDDEVFTKELLSLKKTSKTSQIYYSVKHLNPFTLFCIGSVLFGIVVLSYFYLIPKIAEAVVVFVPKSTEKEIGDTVFKLLVDKSNSKIDEDKTALVTAFYKELDPKNEANIHFFVVKQSIVNAFALSNGSIIIYEGLIDKIDNYEELAALMGHEIAHVNQRHHIKLLVRSIAGYVIISALFSDINGVVAVISENVKSVQNLAYSREFETQADKESVLFLINNKINPNGMINLLQKIDNDKFALPDFIRSHPLSAKRIETLNQLLSEKTAQFNSNPVLEDLFDKISK